MLQRKKWLFLLTIIISLGGCFWVFNRNEVTEIKDNPVPFSTIKDLAERYKPTVVFDKNTLFYPIRFDGLKKIALEVDKEVVAELDITNELKNISNSLNHPKELFENAPENSLIYYYSLSTIPERWQSEKVLDSFPDTLSLYVNATFDEYLKITYTIPFEGNQWRNHHRGDGAMFALYFKEKEGTFHPIKARAYMHLQHIEIDFQDNIISTSEGNSTPVFFVTSGSHSTYHRPRKYEDVDGLPFINAAETAKNGYAYCPDRTQLIFTDNTRNNLEKWAFQGKIYWGGSPNDRIYNADDFIGKVPLIRSLPLGNKSAKMSADPSSVFDKKEYDGGDFGKEEIVITCE